MAANPVEAGQVVAGANSGTADASPATLPDLIARDLLPLAMEK